MIKILNEEPVIYRPEEDANRINSWIYKNPTKAEMDELLSSVRYPSFRVLIKGNDYYICDAFYFVHSVMAKLLYRENKLHLNDYDLALSTTEDTILFAEKSESYKSRKLEDKDIDILIKFIPEFLKLKIVNGTAEISFYGSTQDDIYPLTINELA